jgi:hypothetical protein
MCSCTVYVSVCSILNQGDIVHDGSHVSTHHKSAQFQSKHVTFRAVLRACFSFRHVSGVLDLPV